MSSFMNTMALVGILILAFYMLIFAGANICIKLWRVLEDIYGEKMGFFISLIIIVVFDVIIIAIASAVGYLVSEYIWIAYLVGTLSTIGFLILVVWFIYKLISGYVKYKNNLGKSDDNEVTKEEIEDTQWKA